MDWHLNLNIYLVCCWKISKTTKNLGVGSGKPPLVNTPSSPMWALELGPKSSLAHQWNQLPQPALAAHLINQRSSLLALPVCTCTVIVELRLNSSRQRRATGDPQTCKLRVIPHATKNWKQLFLSATYFTEHNPSLHPTAHYVFLMVT